MKEKRPSPIANGNANDMESAKRIFEIDKKARILSKAAK